MTAEEETQYDQDMQAFAKIEAAQHKLISCLEQGTLIATLKDQCDIAFQVQETELILKIAKLDTEIARLKNG